jgi:hypothetical protein
MLKITKQFFIIIFISFLVGCASNNPQKMYSGPEKSQSDLALLIWNNQAVKPGYNGVQITKIDGEDTSLFNGAKAWVLPGKHKVIQKCFRPYQKHSVTVDGKVYGKDPSEIIVEAGKRYFYQGKAKVVTKYKDGVLGKYWECDLHHWEI